MIDVNCFNCGVLFSIYPGRSTKNKTHHCSTKCSGVTSSKRQTKKVCRTCSNCGKEIFYKKSHSNKIVNPTCSRLCMSQYRSKYYVGYKNTNCKNFTALEKVFHNRVTDIKKRAENKKLEFDLTKEDLIKLYNSNGGKCHYTNLPMSLEKKGMPKYNTMSVDRIDSTKGYTIDNVVLCLFSINMLKAHHDLSDIRTVFRAMYMKEKSNVVVKIKRLYETSILPKQSDPSAAGYDCFTHRIEETDTTLTVFTGISVQPEMGTYFMLVPRSSTHKRGLILYNNIGIIDSNYSGEIIAIFKKTSEYTEGSVSIGDRLVQLIPQEQIWADLVEVDDFNETDRSSFGFGSTGR